MSPSTEPLLDGKIMFIQFLNPQFLPQCVHTIYITMQRLRIRNVCSALSMLFGKLECRLRETRSGYREYVPRAKDIDIETKRMWLLNIESWRR